MWGTACLVALLIASFLIRYFVVLLRRERSAASCPATGAHVDRGASNISTLSGAKISLLLWVPHVQRIPLLLRHYGCMPWELRMAVPHDGMRVCATACGRQCSCYAVPSPSHNSWCYGNPVCHLLPEHANGTTSLLYAHSDLWLHPGLMQQIIRQDPLAMMQPWGGLVSRHTGLWEPNQCFPLRILRNVTAWHWRDTQSPTQHAAQCANGVRYHKLRAVQQFDKCCHGWIDLLYLPRTVHARLRNVAQGFTNVFMEVAITTALHALASSASIRRKDVNCSGSCCSTVPWSKVESCALCTHRVGLHQYDAALPHTFCNEPDTFELLRARIATMRERSQSKDF